MSASAPTTAGSTGAGIKRLTSLAAGVATPIVLVGIAVVPFFTPLWIFPGQARAHADAWTGWPIETVNRVTGEVLVDLILGPPDFDQAVDGVPVFDEREKTHEQDFRTLLIVFALVEGIAAASLAIVWWTARGGTAAWRGVRTGAKVLAVAVVALGILSVLAFDTAFELFHTLLFPQGSFTFDPATERLVQLFPESFWYETAVAVGVVIVALALSTIALATWRIRHIERAAASAAAALASDPAQP